MKRYVVFSSFLIIAPIAFFSTFFLYLYVSFHADPSAKEGLFFKHVRSVSYAALPTIDSFLTGEITSEDARVEIVRQFLARYNSPLEPHAAYIVKTAEKYNMDYRLIPAIAMQESNLCKKSRPEAYNCWGFGIYGDKYLHFDSYEHGIETVTKTLAEKYKDKHGLVTANQIMTMYTPNSNGSWANGVNYFMAEME
jgi:hypothetical protein